MFLSRSYGFPQPGLVLVPLFLLISLSIPSDGGVRIPFWLLVLITISLLSTLVNGNWSRLLSIITVGAYSIGLFRGLFLIKESNHFIIKFFWVIIALNILILLSGKIERFGGIWDNPNMAGMTLAVMWFNRLLKITKVFLCDISNVVLINAFKKLVVFTSHFIFSH